MNSTLAPPIRPRVVADRIWKLVLLSLAIPLFSPRQLIRFIALSVLIVVGCQQESARWEFATAQQLLENGRSQDAIRQMRSAVAKSNEHWELAMLFAVELAKLQDRESIAICDRVLGQKQVESNELLLKLVRKKKIECQSFMGDFAGALDTLKIVLGERIETDERSLNELAYHRALADTQLDLATQEIDEAIQTIASDWCCGERLELDDRAVVASALLARYFLAESRYDPSIESPELAVERMLKSLDFLNRSIESIESKHDKVIRCLPNDTTQVNLNRCTLRANLAVLLIVRAIILQDLGLDSESDRLQASQNSNDIEKLILNLPSEQACLNVLTIAAPFLDTRGFVKSKRLDWTVDRSRESYESALRDLNVAIFACQVERRALRGQLFNNVNCSVQKAKYVEQLLKRSEAVLRYHRLMTFERNGNLKDAQADRIEIEELGYAVNHQLF